MFIGCCFGLYPLGSSSDCKNIHTALLDLLQLLELLGLSAIIHGEGAVLCRLITVGLIVLSLGVSSLRVLLLAYSFILVSAFWIFIPSVAFFQ